MGEVPPVTLDAAAILQHVPDAIVVVDRRELVVAANPAAAEFFGAEPGALLGLQLGDLVPTWAQHAHRAQVAGYFDKPKPRSFGSDHPLVARRRDGGELAVDIALAHTQVNGEMFVIAALRDRTRQLAAEQARAVAEAEARASQQRLHRILEAAPDFIVEVDRAGLVRFANRARTVPVSTLIGRDWLWSVPPEQQPALREVLSDVLATGMARDFQFESLGADGLRRLFLGRIGPLHRTEEGGVESIVGAVIVAQDGTEQRRLQAELDAAQRLASVGTLAAGVAHEINNPLASVIANLSLAIGEVSELAAKGVQCDELLAELNDAKDGAERIRAIARDLKVLARPKNEPTGPVEVVAVFESMLRLAANELRHHARVVRDYREVPPVEADDGRLGQVLLNLLLNAAQAIPDGNAERNTVRVATRRAPNGMVCLEVKDSGPGMADEVKAQLFTPFFTTKEGTGTGLGLAICDKIVRGFGGRIEVESELGRGTTFRVLLPAAAVAPQTIEPRAADTPANEAPRARVLVIDDEPSVGTAVRRVLSGAHDVTTLSSAREALALFEQGARFDVIFCDVMMPDMSGPDLIEALGRQLPEAVAKVVLITGGAFSKRAREFLDNTNHLVLDKPFHPQRLRDVVTERVRARA